MNFKEWFMQESIYDPNLLKAVVMLGGAGSGKSYVTKFFERKGYQINQSDLFFTNLLNKNSIPLSKVDRSDPKQDSLFRRSVSLNDIKMGFGRSKSGHIASMHPIVVESTGANLSGIKYFYNSLQREGYDLYAVYVKVPFDVAMQRNQDRGKSGDRVLSPEVMEKVHKNVAANIDALKNLFGPNFFEINNDGQQIDGKINQVVNTITNTPVENPIGKRKLKQEIEQAHLQAKQTGFLKGQIDPASYKSADVEPWSGSQPSGSFQQQYGKGGARDWTGSQKSP